MSGMAEQDLKRRGMLNTNPLLKHYYVMDTKPRRRLLKVYGEPYNLDSVLLVPATSDKHFQLTAQHPCPCRDTCPFSFTLRHANQGREIFLMYTWYCERTKISMSENHPGDVFWEAESLSQLMPSPCCCSSLLQCAGGVLVSRRYVMNAGNADAGRFLFSFLRQAAIL